MVKLDGERWCRGGVSGGWIGSYCYYLRGVSSSDVFDKGKAMFEDYAEIFSRKLSRDDLVENGEDIVGLGDSAVD